MNILQQIASTFKHV